MAQSSVTCSERSQEAERLRQRDRIRVAGDDPVGLKIDHEMRCARTFNRKCEMRFTARVPTGRPPFTDALLILYIEAAAGYLRPALRNRRPKEA